MEQKWGGLVPIIDYKAVVYSVFTLFELLDNTGKIYIIHKKFL